MNQHQRGVRPHREPGEVRGARPARRRGRAARARATARLRLRGGAGGRLCQAKHRARDRCRRSRAGTGQGPYGSEGPYGWTGGFGFDFDDLFGFGGAGGGARTGPSTPRRRPADGASVSARRDRRPSTRAGFQQAVGQPERRGRADGRDARWHYLSGPGQRGRRQHRSWRWSLIRQRGAAWTRAIRTTSARSGSSSSAGHRATGRRGRPRASAWASWTPGPICCGVWCCGPAALPPVRALLLNSAARYGAPPAPRAGTTKGTRIRERRSASTWEPRTAARPTVEGGQVPPSCPTRKASAPRRAWWRSRRTASGWWELRGAPAGGRGRRPHASRP